MRWRHNLAVPKATISVSCIDQIEQQIATSDGDTLVVALHAKVEFQGKSLNIPIPVRLTSGANFKTDPLEITIPEDLNRFVRLPFEEFRAWCELVFRQQLDRAFNLGDKAVNLKMFNIALLFDPVEKAFEGNPPSSSGW
jgi:hypothetical protein